MKKKYFIIVAGIFLCSALISVFFAVTKKTSVALYGLTEKEISAVQSVFSDKDFKFIVYGKDDSTLPLEKRITKSPKPAILIARDGAEFKALAGNEKYKAEKEFRRPENLTSSISKNTANFSAGSAAVPLFSDFFEILINKNFSRNSTVKDFSSWQNIEQFALEANKISGAQIAFAGGDAEQFLTLIGALTEALSGTENYIKAVEIINSSIENGEFSAALTAGLLAKEKNAPLFNAVSKLREWNENNILNKANFSASKKDIEVLMERNSVSVTFMALSAHRKLEKSNVEKFASQYFPAGTGGTGKNSSSRNFTGPVIFALALKQNEKVLNAINSLTEKEIQEKMCFESGLAPVITECRTPDRQADDVRYWIAATNETLSGFSADILCTEKEKIELAASLMALVREN